MSRSRIFGARPWQAVVGALLVMLAVVTVVVLRSANSGAASTATTIDGLQAQVQATIPGGASAEITPSWRGEELGGEQLVLTPSRESAEKKAADPFAYGDLAWRAEMLAASLATQIPDLRGYQLAAPDGLEIAVPPSALGLVQGSLPSPEAAAKLTDLGSIPESEALKQMASNLEVLERAMPSPAVSSTEVGVVPVDAASGRFALAVTVGTEAGEALLERSGDVLVGLQTGLVGSPDANVEGLAITVVEAGRPLAASWIATRAMAGTTMLAPGIELPAVQSTDVEFPNLTGGPEVEASGVGDESGLPSLPTSERIRLSSGGRSIYSAKGRLSTPEWSPRTPGYHALRPRPRISVRPCSLVQISFTSPAHSVKLGVRKVTPEGDGTVGVAQPIARQASDDGLVWEARLPGWERLEKATTLHVTAAYPAGWGQYLAGLVPVPGGRCHGGTGSR
jgi:hypothetical protein